MSMLIYKDGYVYSDSFYTDDNTVETIRESTRASDSKVIPFKAPMRMLFDKIDVGDIAPIEGELFYGAWASGNIDVLKGLVTFIRWSNENDEVFKLSNYLVKLDSADVLGLLRPDYGNSTAFISQHRIVVIHGTYNEMSGELTHIARQINRYDETLILGSGLPFTQSYYGLKEALALGLLHPMDVMFGASMCLKSVGGTIHRWAFGPLDGELGLRKVGTNGQANIDEVSSNLRYGLMQHIMRPSYPGQVKNYHRPSSYAPDGERIVEEMNALWEAHVASLPEEKVKGVEKEVKIFKEFVESMAPRGELPYEIPAKDAEAPVLDEPAAPKAKPAKKKSRAVMVDGVRRSDGTYRAYDKPKAATLKPKKVKKKVAK